MATHLIRAQSAYKDIRIHSLHTHTQSRHAHTDTHTRTLQIHGDGLVQQQKMLHENCGCYLYEQLTLEQCWQDFHYCQRKKD